MDVLADGAATTIDLGAFLTTIIGALGDFTTSNLGLILTAALGLTASLAICWFAYGFIKRKVSAAMRKGTL